MIGRLNHVAIAVPDLEAATKVYRDTLGAKVSPAVDQPEHGVTTVFIELPNTKVELLGALGDKSPISAFLQRNPTAASIISATRSRTSSRPATGSSPTAPACSARATPRSAPTASRCSFSIPRTSAARWWSSSRPRP